MDLGDFIHGGVLHSQDAKRYKQRIAFLVAPPRSNTSKLGQRKSCIFPDNAPGIFSGTAVSCPGEQPAGQLGGRVETVVM